jgi:hypothetical protein
MMVVLAYFVMLTMSKANSVEGRCSECECGGFIGGRLNERGQHKQPEECLFKCQFCPPSIHIDISRIEPGLVLQDNTKITKIIRGSTKNDTYSLMMDTCYPKHIGGMSMVH